MTLRNAREVVRRLERAVAPDGAAGPADAGGADQRAQRAVLLGGVDRRGDLVGVGDVGADVAAADARRDRLTALVLQVDDDDGGAAGGQRADASPRRGRWPRR